MGRGDKKSKKGKRWLGSYGVTRNKKAIKAKLKRSASRPAVVTVGAAVEEKPKAKRVSRKKEASAE